MQNVCAVVLAAGDGTRMQTAHPKVLGEVLFRPMVLWVAEALQKAGIENCVAVLGKGHEEVQAILPQHYAHVIQAERKGTGHAVLMAKEYIRSKGFQDVAVLYGDAPFVLSEDIGRAYEQHKTQHNAVTVFSARLRDPAGYGRIVRGADGVKAIVEHKDADADTLEIDEVNAGAYWFEASFLLEFLEGMTASNAQGEYYLTDCVQDAVAKGRRVDAYAASPDTVLGANDRKTLSYLNQLAQKRVVSRLLEEGVDIPFPDQVVVGPQVQIGLDTRLLPGTILMGETVIGADCEIGPHTTIRNSQVGDGCTITSSQIEDSVVGAKATIGPMARLRPGCRLGDRVKIGNFVELKNSTLGEGTSVSHLTYVGDTDTGRWCNFGCGVVTVNYDGNQKSRTTIGDGAFIGCNTNLIAPVTLGDRAYCAAGTTVTDDVPSDALVIGRARQTVKENWNKEGKRFPKGNKSS
ncbi:MAG: bifunctional UDP-N-acetylglucosamine diphosphorylase/glucosamine-1-phosphate N-acetyltransferase GlmU [Oscillospiraceae bacterium]|jgi:bifunctional UDP-N-acetylglucosamine pyrophosphorylase/glucosamine-1-phosphate N-acetyltransferase